MSVEVMFGMRFVDAVDSCVNESELRAHFKRWRDNLVREYPLDGSVTLVCDGQEQVRIDDELWVLVQSICFQAVVPLTLGQTYTYSNFAYLGNVILRPDGDLIHVVGDLITERTFPRSNLLTALYTCGRRFIDFLRLLEHQPPYENVIRDLMELAEPARQALLTQELLPSGS